MTTIKKDTYIRTGKKRNVEIFKPNLTSKSRKKGEDREQSAICSLDRKVQPTEQIILILIN